MVDAASGATAWSGELILRVADDPQSGEQPFAYKPISKGDWDMGLPADVSEPRFSYQQTTRATTQFVTMRAIYSRLIAACDNAEAKAMLKAALRAWNFANTRPAWPPPTSNSTARHNPLPLNQASGDRIHRLAQPLGLADRCAALPMGAGRRRVDRQGPEHRG